MSSGIYSALSGGLAKMQKLDVAVHNLANAGNVGFKASRLSFESMFEANRQNYAGEGKNFCRTAERFVDFSQGDIEQTHRPLDVAIRGEGFFKMAGDDGFLYTRQGNFELDDQGNLVTADGRKQVVGANGPVNLPHSNVQIDAQGRISADGAQVGQISVYSVSDPKALSEKGDGLYALAPDAAAAPAPDAELVQGGIEHANVDPVLLTTEIIETKRAYAAYLKVMKAYSDMGEKAESLGRIG